MKNILMEIQQALLNNAYIKEMTYNSDTKKYRVRAYEYPENGDHSGAFITIRPIEPQNNGTFGSNQNLNLRFWVQIDVEASYPTVAKELQYNVNKELQKLRFVQTDGGLDEYFSETKRYVDARRYFGASKFYDTEY